VAKKKKKIRFGGWVMFIVYIILAVYFLIFSDMLDRTMISEDYRYNLELFAEIKRFWIYRDQLGWESIAVNLVGNVVCFIPFGFLLPILSKKKIGKRFVGAMLISLLFIVTMETIQLYTKVGAFDVDDIVLNMSGCCIGYILNRLTIKKYT